MMKKADIYIDDTFCGVLTEDSEGYHQIQQRPEHDL